MLCNQRRSPQSSTTIEACFRNFHDSMLSFMELKGNLHECKNMRIRFTNLLIRNQPKKKTKYPRLRSTSQCPDFASENAKCSRLSSSIGPQQTEALTFLYPEAYAFDCIDVPQLRHNKRVPDSIPRLCTFPLLVAGYYPEV